MKYLLGFLIFISFYASALECKKPEAGSPKQVFCFFSLNSAKEFKTFKDKNKIPLPNNVEVVEFYGEDHKGQSVKERFKTMMQEKVCTSLVISGHHTGFFTGDQSESAQDGLLELDFLEEMSCEPACEDWFSYVKSLFLMGCKTLNAQVRSSDFQCQEFASLADCESARVAMEYDITSTYGHGVLNQAYSSTLDHNTNPLSGQYLKMFPSAGLYGWGRSAPGAGSLSQNSIPNFISFVSELNNPPAGTPEPGVELRSMSTQDFVRALDILNNPSHPVCRKFPLAGLWTKHWDKGTRPTACYLKAPDTGHRKRGCALSRALKNPDDKGTNIQTALSNILDSGPEGIKKNFNHLMSLISPSNQNLLWYPKIKQELKGHRDLKNILLNILKTDDNIGFTRRADYLFFYREMGWREDENQIAKKFLEQVTQAVNSISNRIRKGGDKPTVVTGYKRSALGAVRRNNIGPWLYEQGPQLFTEFLNKYPPEDVKMLCGKDKAFDPSKPPCRPSAPKEENAENLTKS